MAHIDIPDARYAVGRAVTTSILESMRRNAFTLYQDTHFGIVKAADQSVNNSTVPVDDNDFFFEVEPNDIWHVRFRLTITDPTSAFMSWKFSLPSKGAPSYGFVLADTNPPRSVQLNFEADALQPSGAVDIGWIDVILAIGATGGTVQFQWAQTSAKVGDTTILAGSILMAQRLDPIGAPKTYAEIADSRVDPKSPGTSGLGKEIRDAPFALYQERTGIIKAVTQKVNNTTVLQTDDELSFEIGANQVRQFSFRLRLATPSTAGLSIRIAGPAGVTGYVYGYYPHEGIGTLRDFAGAVGATIALPTISTLFNDLVVIEGFIVSGATAGTVTLDWAQNVATVGDTEIRLGSFLSEHRLDRVSPTGVTYSPISLAAVAPEAPLTTVLRDLRDNGVASYNRVRVFEQKPVDQSKTQDTTLADDNDLVFSVGANELWHALFVLDVSTGPVHDIKVQIATPDAGDAGTFRGWFELNAAGNLDSLKLDVNTSLQLNLIPAGSTSSVIFIEGYVETGGTAGAVRLQWAQNVSQPSATTVKQGSFVWARRMDDLE